MPAHLTFLGAAREVTGSCYLLEDPSFGRVLLDCGMHQGGDDVERRREEELPPDLAHIDAVILSHAHLDHSGLLPKLFHNGFDGPIYCTAATADLLDIMLNDAVGLYSYDLKKENIRRARRGQPQLEPEFTEGDVMDVLDACRPCDYESPSSIGERAHVCFYDAGHILGSSIVEIKWQDHNREVCMVFSGDLGNEHAVLMNDPTPLTHADVVLMEGTYGDRNHRSHDDTIEEFEHILHQTWERGGNVMMPAFAVGRTQEILFHLGRLHHAGKLDNWKIFLDSPMAIKVTEVYDRWLDALDPADLKKLGKPLDSFLKGFLPQLQPTVSTEESIAINDHQQGALIIAGSGMCTGGRIRHHLKQRIWQERNTLLFAGFQARGTLGRILVDGAKSIKLFGEEYIVKAQIETLGGFSAHAGQSELINWAANFRSSPQFYLVHGEDEKLEILADKLKDELKLRCHVPRRGEQVKC